MWIRHNYVIEESLDIHLAQDTRENSFVFNTKAVKIGICTDIDEKNAHIYKTTELMCT